MMWVALGFVSRSIRACVSRASEVYTRKTTALMLGGPGPLALALYHQSSSYARATIITSDLGVGLGTYLICLECLSVYCNIPSHHPPPWASSSRPSTPIDPTFPVSHTLSTSDAKEGENEAAHLSHPTRRKAIACRSPKHIRHRPMHTPRRSCLLTCPSHLQHARRLQSSLNARFTRLRLLLDFWEIGDCLT